MRQEPGPGILGIVLEPGFRRAQAKAVAPPVHVPEHLAAAHFGYMIGEKDLQIADRGLLGVVAPGIARKPRPPRLRHAHVVARFVEDGVDGGVAPYVDLVPDETGL